MVTHEISFRVQHDCPFNDLSRKYPNVPISQWCNYDNDVLEIKCDDIALFDEIQGDLEKMGDGQGTPIVRKAFGPKNVQVVVKRCACCDEKGSIGRMVSRHNCMYLPPIYYHDGWEHWRIIAFNNGDVKKLFKDIMREGVVEILSKKNTPDRSVKDSITISIGDFFADLTEKQMSTFLTALDNGYYEVPKRVTLEQIAKFNQLPRTTYEEHVRKAESKILHAIAPYARLQIQLT